MRPDAPLTPLEREHGRAARDTALALLQALYRRRDRTARDLADALGLDVAVVQAGLRGLQARGRVDCDGKGANASWALTHDRRDTAAQKGRP